ncbi:MAG: UTP--glucose-1-phosphate uridylyltransferase [Synoicihabitans sp.]
MHPLLAIIREDDAAIRDQSVDSWCEDQSLAALIEATETLETYRREESNLYQRVRALFFLHTLHRYHLPRRTGLGASGQVPYRAFQHLWDRRFEEAIGVLLREQSAQGPNDTLCSALAAGYHALAFQTLANQVRRTVRSTRGNAWMFRLGHPLDQPLKVRRELIPSETEMPLLVERTAVRMDLTHCAWSDIFFLGMDYPEGARVLNVSIDLGVHGRDTQTRPPVEAFFRVIDEPVLRLASVDLETSVCISDLEEVFDFGRDYLGLLKAAVIAAGIVPPGIERSGAKLDELLGRIFGSGRGFELISNVNGIPKGSRLAVSTNLLGALIAACMRATGQIAQASGPLTERDRRMVAARAILGEWLGGSGGGWQDSGGIWPGIKLIEGAPATSQDAEYGISRGTLLPRHTLLDETRIPASSRQKLQESLVLVHGGMAQNVGPILEMVTEKYLLRSAAEWQARGTTIATLESILEHLASGDIKALGAALTDNFTSALQTIIPWVSNRYTERLIAEVRAEFGDDFWGFWMLGGMSGGGMGFIFDPTRRTEGQARLLEIMLRAKRELEASLPFAMDPVVYDFTINENGSTAELLTGENALLPPAYYRQVTPAILRRDSRGLSPRERTDLTQFTRGAKSRPELGALLPQLLDQMLPDVGGPKTQDDDLPGLLAANGFDAQQHEEIRQDLREGRIGLALNRLPTTTSIEDLADDDLFNLVQSGDAHRAAGEAALARGELAIVTYAAGVGSRWTQGAGCVKGLHPFAKLGGKHRSFIDVHLAKTRQSIALSGRKIPHVFTTSYLTHNATESYLRASHAESFGEGVHLSPGRSIGLRMIPTLRDLQFAWEETAQQKLDEQQQKMLESVRGALANWAQSVGEASDYTDNLPSQCLHPVGHWFEIPNLIKNGTLRNLLEQQPELRTLMVHNIDTLGATADPAMLGWFNASEATLGWEAITKRIEDHGGGFAKINGTTRIVEGMALPNEEDEFRLSYYNANTCWIDIDKLLGVFGLSRDDLDNEDHLNEAVRSVAAKVPTYVTLKDVKKRWGHGQEDVYPVAQFEKLWGDMTALTGVTNAFALVPRPRGQQLKDQAQLDSWQRDGSAAHVASLCAW